MSRRVLAPLQGASSLCLISQGLARLTAFRRWPLATFPMPLAGHARLTPCPVYVELTLKSRAAETDFHAATVAGRAATSVCTLAAIDFRSAKKNFWAVENDLRHGRDCVTALISS